MGADIDFPFWETSEKLVDFLEQRTGEDLSTLRSLLQRETGFTFHSALAKVVFADLALPAELLAEVLEAKASVLDGTDDDFREVTLDWFARLEEHQAQHRRSQSG